MKTPTKNMNLLDRLADEAAGYELEFGTPTKESRAAAQRYGGAITDRLAEMRRADLANIETPARKRPVSKSLLAMGRDALIARLNQLFESPQLAVVHQDLSHVTDDDLRTMIDDAENALEAVRDPS